MSNAALRPSLSIGEVAKRSALRPSAIRYYERTGVLPPPARASGRRRYGPEILRRLALIDVAQRAGFTLEEIRLLSAGRGRGAAKGWRRLAARKLPEVDALILRAMEMRRLLVAGGECGCSRITDCRLLGENRDVVQRRGGGRLMRV